MTRKLFIRTKLEKEIGDETARRICLELKEFEPISHLHFDVCFILLYLHIFGNNKAAQCSKINEKAMILFAEYFAEHSIHTLKLSLVRDVDPSKLTNLLKPFESINVRKLAIEVGIGFIPQIT